MVRVSVSGLHLTGRPSACYSAKVNRSVKVFGFVQFRGPTGTVLSLSQKPDTPRVVDFWMSALAGITLFSAVFPTLSLHRTLESVCPPSVNPVKGLCETGSTTNFWELYTKLHETY